MTSFRESVDEEIRQTVERELEGSDVSVTYFQGANDNDCESDVTIATPDIVGEPFILDPPSAGGSTLIVTALKALRDIQTEEQTLVTLYTDGSYADSVCETPEDICSALADLRRSKPQLDFNFAYPPAIRTAGRPVLSCAGEPSTSLGLAEEVSTDPPEDVSEVPVWPSIAAWSVIPWVFVFLLALNTMSRRRHTKHIEESYEIEDPKKSVTKSEWRAYTALWIVLGLAALCLLVYAFRGPTTWRAFGLVYEEANRPLLAIVFAWVLTVVSGWYFVEVLNDIRARQNKQWRINHTSALERAEAKEVARIKELISDRYSYQQDRDGSVALRVQEKLSNEERERFSMLFSKVESIRARLLEMIGEVQSYAILDKNDGATFSNPRSISRLLTAAYKLDKPVGDEVTSLLEDWRRLLGKLPTIDVTIESNLLSFDLQKLSAPASRETESIK
ncbi:hypothetical protein [Hyphomonas sp.]|uniref:hypothetical protein n=1 Tax=Hyphomonas sp. TaxID=87 RepID=UPI003D2795A6